MRTNDQAALIFGCGYIGWQVAVRWQQQNQPSAAVYTVTRNPQKAQQMAQAGFQPIIADWTDRRTLQSLPRCRQVLVAVSYDSRSRMAREDSQVGGLNHLLDVLPHESRIVYLSTTGVYHQSQGEWVDESSVTWPNYPGGRTHLRAEECLHRRRPHGVWTVLRLSGIYGPGRIPRLADLQSGKILAGSGDGWLNLIHRDDVAEAVLAAWRSLPDLPRRLLVSDDRPVIRHQFYDYAAQLASTPPARFDPAATSAASLRSSSNKRVWNRRLKQLLLPQLQFPTFVEGLNDLLR